MESVVGVVDSEARARQVAGEIVRRFPRARIRILTPDVSAGELAQLPTDDAEQPGMGSAIGAVAGGAAGAAAATMLIPPAGAIAVLGIATGALLGGLGGMATGHKLEDSLSFGLPRDELLVYAHALDSGQSLVIGWVETDADARRVRELLRDAGVHSVDAARDAWWVGLRDAEGLAYGDGFEADEAAYRRGFEAACRGDVSPAERQRAFDAGYARGRVYVEDQMRQLAVTRPAVTNEERSRDRPPL
jgi:hypothetical protein